MKFPAYRVVSKRPTLASASILSSSARNKKPLQVPDLTVGSDKRRMRRFARLTSSTLLPADPVDCLVVQSRGKKRCKKTQTRRRQLGSRGRHGTGDEAQGGSFGHLGQENSRHSVRPLPRPPASASRSGAQWDGGVSRSTPPTFKGSALDSETEERPQKTPTAPHYRTPNWSLGPSHPCSGNQNSTQRRFHTGHGSRLWHAWTVYPHLGSERPNFSQDFSIM